MSSTSLSLDVPFVFAVPAKTSETPKLKKKYTENLEKFNRIINSHTFQQHKKKTLYNGSYLRLPYKFDYISFGTYIPDSIKPDKKRSIEPKDSTSGKIKILSNTEEVIKSNAVGVIPGKKTVVSFYKDISLYGALLSLAHMKNSGSTTLVSSSMITPDDLQLIESSSISIGEKYLIKGNELSVNKIAYHQSLLKNSISEDSIITFSDL